MREFLQSQRCHLRTLFRESVGPPAGLALPSLGKTGSRHQQRRRLRLALYFFRAHRLSRGTGSR